MFLKYGYIRYVLQTARYRDETLGIENEEIFKKLSLYRTAILGGRKMRGREKESREIEQ